ncbi:MAG: FAD-dependent oxidoreductase [Myxococcaceae bacterium]|nr:FAD-dependent oxidoreductase [Myxococcaceae bacterium]
MAPHDNSFRVLFTRRHLIKTVIAGGASAVALSGCPVEHTPVLDAGQPSFDAGLKFTHSLAGEDFSRCHGVRDGAAFSKVAPTQTVETVIVGGGPSGLYAAHRLADRDVLLLEKEPDTGGNCRFDEWRGVRMSTGGAYYNESETQVVKLLAEIGAQGTRVEGSDSLIIHGQPTVDIFRDGAQQLPFSQTVRDDFRRSREVCLKLVKTKKAAELDALTFSKVLEPFSVEVKQFWDSFGQSSWGATTDHTSAYVGCEAYSWAGGADDARYTYPGGLSGAAVKLAAAVKAKRGESLRTGAVVTSIEVEGTGQSARAIIRWFEGDEPKAIRAKAVIVAAPKYIAKRMLSGLPPARVEAMNGLRYLPFCMFNVCLDSVGPEPAYDNFFIDTPFTDFIPADWVIHAGKGPKARPTALTVYHPLAETRRAELLSDERIAALAEEIAEHLERHFPGTMSKIREMRAFRRGHAMYASTPGSMARSTRVSTPIPPVFFANTDCSNFSTFGDAINAGHQATLQLRKYLKARG